MTNVGIFQYCKICLMLKNLKYLFISSATFTNKENNDMIISIDAEEKSI